MALDLRNVKDEYKNWHEDLIRADIAQKSFPYAVLMQHLNGDFNFSNVIRSANAFGAKEIFYFGKKRFDRRGAVGSYIYKNVRFLSSIDELIQLKNTYNFVALEQASGSKSLDTFEWPDNPLILLGEESKGLTEEVLELCLDKVEIPQFGSVRSLNAATAAGIGMFDFISKYNNKRN